MSKININKAPKNILRLKRRKLTMPKSSHKKSGAQFIVVPEMTWTDHTKHIKQSSALTHKEIQNMPN